MGGGGKETIGYRALKKISEPKGPLRNSYAGFGLKKKKEKQTVKRTKEHAQRQQQLKYAETVTSIITSRSHA